MKNIIYLLGIVLFISCSVHKERIMQLYGQNIIVNKKPNYEYLDCKVYPEVVYKNQKRRDINIYLYFMYDSIYFSKKTNNTDSKEATKMDRTLFFDSHLSYPNPFIMTEPDGLMCFTLSVLSYCDYFQKIGLYKKYDTTKKASQKKKYHFPIVDDTMCGQISIPGWVKLIFEKSFPNGKIFHTKHKNKKKRWGITNFEKIDTLWISTLYNDIIIPIDTNKTTTEKIPLPF